MKKLFPLLFIAIAFSCQAQQAEKFNLNFEVQSEEEGLPDGWFKWGTYDLETDNKAHSGKKAVKIKSDEEGTSFGSVAYKIPANYSGESIKLEGFMKIKNVEGFAGLLLRIDGNGAPLAFGNMSDRQVSGTIDWQMYSIILDYPEGAENIYLGGIISGKGEAWFDDFVLTIDGENIQTLKEVEKVLPGAKLDKEFDQGSNITLTELTAENINDLELLGRIWGFLKYHHPEMAGGNYNWDYELFRFLSRYLQAENEDERNDLVINWIDSFGELEKCNSCKPVEEEAFLKPDLQWMEDQDDALKNKLLSVYNSRSQGMHYYLEFDPNIGNPEFKNENAYTNMPYPDAGFRLLSLYRYWNKINYFFPYKHLMDKDWNLVLRDYIPVFLNAENELEYEFAALQLIGEIQDTHANLWGGADKIQEWKGSNYPPFHLRFIEDKLVVTDFYNPELKAGTGLEIGNVITAINGKKVEDIVRERSKYYPASNTPTQLRDISREMLRSDSTEVEIRYISGNSAEKSKSLKLYPAEDLNIYGWYRPGNDKSYKMLKVNVGYVSLQNIQDEDIPRIKKEFKDTKGIIIDIRNYPSAFVPFSLGSYFLSEDTPFVKFTSGSIDNPGVFTFSNPLEIPAEDESYKGKLIVLVNELSQSNAEYTAMAFRAGKNTTIIGSTTAGADGNVSEIMLPGGLRTMISGIGVYYPDGTETQRVGIVPDIEVKPSINGIRNSRDELLEKAIEVIMKD